MSQNLFELKMKPSLLKLKCETVVEICENDFSWKFKEKENLENFAVKSFENHGSAIKEEILKIAMRANLGDCTSITSL